ncbi:MAG: hypothetical protein HY559_05710 [Gammaproteobacteria bacterium]|nr:hypothetical protein [Gammaproteobacteria bacterium]
MQGKRDWKRLGYYFILVIMSFISLKGMAGELPNGQLCSQAADCLSDSCQVGPENKYYCTSEDKACPQPGGSGVIFGEDYLHKGVEYYCKREGIVEVPSGGQLENGRLCALSSDCSSGYCYPGDLREKKYCIAPEKNCPLPGNSGVMFDESYTHNGRYYICKQGRGLVPGKLIDGQPCANATDCGSGYCYAGPDNMRYCLAANMHCARPWHGGIFFGQNYSYHDRRYYCKQGVGLIPERLSKDGQLCSSSGQCKSNSCRGGPENKKFCIGEEMHCPEPGRSGIKMGSSYVYEGIKYYCTKEKRLVKY